MLISRWSGIVLICFALSGAASETFAGGLARPGNGAGAVAPPGLSIVAFDASGGIDNIYTFEGKVTGGDGSPITINFGNLPSLIGKTVTVASDGSFLFTIELTSEDFGLASAQAVNAGGQTSSPAYTPVFP